MVGNEKERQKKKKIKIKMTAEEHPEAMFFLYTALNGRACCLSTNQMSALSEVLTKTKLKSKLK